MKQNSGIVRIIISYAIACLVAAGMIALYFSLREEYATAAMIDKVRMWCDAFTIPAVLYIMIGGLVWSASLGSMDGLSYGVTRLLRSLVPGGRSKKDASYREYVELRKEKRLAFHKYAFLFVVGGICAVTAIVLLIVFLQMEAA